MVLNDDVASFLLRLTCRFFRDRVRGRVPVSSVVQCCSDDVLYRLAVIDRINWYAVIRYNRKVIYHIPRSNGGSDDYCLAAVENNNSSILRLLLDRGYCIDPRCPLFAASCGHVDMFKWMLMHRNGQVEIHRCVRIAAENGHLNIVELLAPISHLNYTVQTSAARGGHLSIIGWCRNRGYDWVKDTAPTAAKAGHLHILEWIVVNQLPFSETNCYTAALDSNQSSVLKWLEDRQH
jgi:hypothetical protein